MSAKNQKIIKCLKCNIDFSVKASYAKRAKYCSKKCSASVKRGSYKDKVKVVCSVCKKEFERLPSLSKVKYCSTKCRGLTQRTDLITKNCVICDKSFESKPIKNRLYCSKNCHNFSLKTNGIANIKTKNTNIEKYGVEYVSQNEIVKHKKHNTMKTNLTYGKSKIEDKLYSLLCSCYDNVERQVRINGWNIDFLIAEKQTYLQLDGVYWHGLNRSTEIIEQSKSHRDKHILKVIEKDKQQNEWFEKNNIKLIRLTDTVVKKIKEPMQLKNFIEMEIAL